MFPKRFQMTRGDHLFNTCQNIAMTENEWFKICNILDRTNENCARMLLGMHKTVWFAFSAAQLLINKRSQSWKIQNSISANTPKPNQGHLNLHMQNTDFPVCGQGNQSTMVETQLSPKLYHKFTSMDLAKNSRTSGVPFLGRFSFRLIRLLLHSACMQCFCEPLKWPSQILTQSLLYFT